MSGKVQSLKTTLLSALFCSAIIYIPIKSASNPLLASADSSVMGKAECVMELNSRRILYAYNAEEALPMASTTKILTAATVLNECANLEERIKIPQEAEGVEGSSVYLKSGDEYSVQDLLYGLMLRSGNDCALALALSFGKTVSDFSIKMNQTAEKAGALNSHFENPHGLPSREHYTTARDLSYITCYAMQNPVFREIVATKYYTPHSWKNKNKILHLYEGGIGVKTGYTKEAGRCLVSAANRENMTLICSLLNCPTTYERTAQLFNDAFSTYKYETLLSKNEEFCLGEGKEQIKARAKSEFCYPLIEEEKQFIEIKTKPISSSLKKKKTGEIVGQIEIYLAKQLLFSTNLYKL